MHHRYLPQMDETSQHEANWSIYGIHCFDIFIVPFKHFKMNHLHMKQLRMHLKKTNLNAHLLSTVTTCLPSTESKNVPLFVLVLLCPCVFFVWTDFNLFSLNETEIIISSSEIFVACLSGKFVAFADSFPQKLYSAWKQKSGRTSATLRLSFSRRPSLALSLRSTHGSRLQAKKHLCSTRLRSKQMEGQTGTKQVSNNQLDYRDL